MSPNLSRAADIFGEALGRVSKYADDAPYAHTPPTPAEIWAQAQSIAHDPAQLLALKRDGTLIYADLCLTWGDRVLDVDEAHDVLRLHITCGRYEDAEALGRAITDELARAVEKLIERGSI